MTIGNKTCSFEEDRFLLLVKTLHDVLNFSSTQFRTDSLGGHYLLLLLMDEEYTLTLKRQMSIPT